MSNVFLVSRMYVVTSVVLSLLFCVCGFWCRCYSSCLCMFVLLLFEIVCRDFVKPFPDPIRSVAGVVKETHCDKTACIETFHRNKFSLSYLFCLIKQFLIDVDMFKRNESVS